MLKSLSLVQLCALKERERQEHVKGLACMFCKEVMDGKRAVLFDHLWEIHHFFVGSCDNLVHIDEFVALLHKRLHVDKQCLKCVKKFGTYDQLRLHMRKKKHCEIAGNKEFDRFYLSNYVNKGSSEREQNDDDDNDASSGDVVEGEEWEGWVDEEVGQGTLCLFCNSKMPSSTICIDHMRLKHDFDLVNLKC
jgi:hypothetical protein